MLAHNGLSVVREPLTPPRSLKPPPGLNSLISSLRSEDSVNGNDSATTTAPSTNSSTSPFPSLKNITSNVASLNQPLNSNNNSPNPISSSAPNQNPNQPSSPNLSATNLVPEHSQQQRLDDERVQWQRWAMYAAEMERNRRISVLREMELEEVRNDKTTLLRCCFPLTYPPLAGEGAAGA